MINRESSAAHRLDLGRTQRLGLPEAVYCAGKTVDQCVQIVQSFLADGTDTVIATRASETQQEALAELAPTNHVGTTLTWRHRDPTGCSASIVSAGTSDLPVSDEVRLVLAAMGHQANAITDVGVAGLHRLTDALPDITANDLVVAIAGMEGALPTVLAGLIPHPIIAIPTSVGYGTAFEGMTALHSMLASCAPGISVVGIDNGYGAACAAHRLLSALQQ
jgi:NCAIR mutase (PurE)-related protein